MAMKEFHEVRLDFLHDRQEHYYKLYFGENDYIHRAMFFDMFDMYSEMIVIEKEYLRGM